MNEEEQIREAVDLMDTFKKLNDERLKKWYYERKKKEEKIEEENVEIVEADRMITACAMREGDLFKYSHVDIMEAIENNGDDYVRAESARSFNPSRLEDGSFHYPISPPHTWMWNIRS